MIYVGALKSAGGLNHPCFIRSNKKVNFRQRGGAVVRVSGPCTEATVLLKKFNFISLSFGNIIIQLNCVAQIIYIVIFTGEVALLQ